MTAGPEGAGPSYAAPRYWGLVDALPEEVIHRVVVDHLGWRDVLVLSSVCVALHRITAADGLWAELYRRDFETELGMYLNRVDFGGQAAARARSEAAAGVSWPERWSRLDTRDIDNNLHTTGFPAWMDAYAAAILHLSVSELAVEVGRREIHGGRPALGTERREREPGPPIFSSAYTERFARTDRVGDSYEGTSWCDLVYSFNPAAIYRWECFYATRAAKPKGTLARVVDMFHRRSYFMFELAPHRDKLEKARSMSFLTNGGESLVFVSGGHDGVFSFCIEDLRRFVSEGEKAVAAPRRPGEKAAPERELPRKTLARSGDAKKILRAKMVYIDSTQDIGVVLAVSRTPAEMINSRGSMVLTAASTMALAKARKVLGWQVLCRYETMGTAVGVAQNAALAASLCTGEREAAGREKAFAEFARSLEDIRLHRKRSFRTDRGELATGPLLNK